MKGDTSLKIIMAKKKESLIEKAKHIWQPKKESLVEKMKHIGQPKKKSQKISREVCLVGVLVLLIVFVLGVFFGKCLAWKHMKHHKYNSGGYEKQYDKMK